MKVWLGAHEVPADGFALRLSGCAPDPIAAPRRLTRLLEDSAEGICSVEVRARKDGQGGLLATAQCKQGHLVLRCDPPRDGTVEARLTVHGLRQLSRIVQLVEAIVLRVLPREVALTELADGGSSGPRPYPPYGALFLRTIHERKSPLQHIQVAEHPVYGRVLLLNGETQIAALDERLYSASLARPALRAGARRVLILGGGDCGVLREVLEHPGVEEVVMVEIDPQVVEVASEYFPDVVGGARVDPRARIVYADALDFLRGHVGFDVVIYDLSDAPLNDVSYDEVCRLIDAALAPKGRVAVQCGSTLPRYRAHLRGVLRAMERTFRKVSTREVVIPSFLHQPWVFATGRKGKAKQKRKDRAAAPAEASLAQEPAPPEAPTKAGKRKKKRKGQPAREAEPGAQAAS